MAEKENVGGENGMPIEEEMDLLFSGDEMVSKDTFTHNGKPYPMKYNKMPVNVDIARKLKTHLIRVGYNELFIHEMRTLGKGNYLVSAEKTNTGGVGVNSGLPEDTTLFDKIFGNPQLLVILPRVVILVMVILYLSFIGG